MQVSDRIEALRKKSTDENSFLKKVVAYTQQIEALRKTYSDNYQRNGNDLDSFNAMHKMEQVNSMLHGYISFHSVSQYPVREPIREYYNMASLDKDGNAVFTKKTEVIRKIQ